MLLYLVGCDLQECWISNFHYRDPVLQFEEFTFLPTSGCPLNVILKAQHIEVTKGCFVTSGPGGLVIIG